MTIQEFKDIIKKEVNHVTVAQRDNGDLYVIDTSNMKILAWICGKEANHFTIYSGLSDRVSWRAVNHFAETLPNERGLSRQVN